jgi:hypothetical protein
MSIIKPIGKHYSQAEAFTRIYHPGLIESMMSGPRTPFSDLLARTKEELLKSRPTRKRQNKR